MIPGGNGGTQPIKKDYSLANLEWFENRINKGTNDGTLTKKEAAQLQHQEDKLAKSMAKDELNGKGDDYAKYKKDLEKMNRAIFMARHNKQGKLKEGKTVQDVKWRPRILGPKHGSVDGAGHVHPGYKHNPSFKKGK